MSDSLVSDQVFDETCQEIDLTLKTGNDEMDTWFEENFEEFTGSWIHTHPNLKRLEEIYTSIKERDKL